MYARTRAYAKQRDVCQTNRCLFCNNTTCPAEQYNFVQDNRGFIEGSSEVGRGSFNQFSVLRTQVQDFKPEYADYLYFI